MVSKQNHRAVFGGDEGILRRQSRLRESADFLLPKAKVLQSCSSRLRRQNPSLRTQGLLHNLNFLKKGTPPRRVVLLFGGDEGNRTPVRK